MKIYRPLRTNFITQKFGENKVPIYKQMGMLGHNGVDFACWKGEPIYHSGEFKGKVRIEYDIHGGRGIDVISLEPFQDNYFIKLRYWHLLEVAVPQNQIIQMGDLIGWGDNTGLSTGNHLHFGFKKCNKNGEAINKNNGYFGGIDFSEYYVNKFILERKIDLLKEMIEELKSKIIELKYAVLKK